MEEKSSSNINTINGLVFKDDLLLMNPMSQVPIEDETNGEYRDLIFVRTTQWYKDNISLYENSLQEAKCVNGIFKESFMDTYNEDGTPTGEVYSYDEVHQNGLWHKAVHIWVVNSRGELLLQRRSNKVQTYPGMWENSAGGHVDAGHTNIETAQKELQEELGIVMSFEKFEHIGTIIEQNILNNGTCINNEFDDFYLVSLGDEKIDIQTDPSEIAEMQWIDFRELEENIQSSNPLYVPRTAEYDILFPLLHKRFDSVVD